MRKYETQGTTNDVSHANHDEMLFQMMCAASCDVTAAIRKLQVIARRVNYAPPGEQVERDRRVDAAVTEINDALGITSAAPIETW